MRKMTKAEAIAEFREIFRNAIPRGDDDMRREAWNNFTDMLCKDRRITQEQYDSWSNPF